MAPADLAAKMSRPCWLEQQHEYLLAPVSGHAHLKRNCSQKPLRSLLQVRFSMAVLEKPKFFKKSIEIIKKDLIEQP